MKADTHERLIAIDLFGGCGGLSEGLLQAGFHVVGTLEFDRLAADSYRLNHPETPILVADIRDVDPTEWAHNLGLRPGRIGLVAGCPPCQGFSSLRTRNGGWYVDDPRNDLIFEFLRFVRALRPIAVMLENVPGLIHDRRFDRFSRSLVEAGYRSDCRILDAADFDVPQRRRRMVFIASRIGPVALAEPTAPTLTVRSSLAHLDEPGLGSDPLHDYRETRQESIRRLITRIPKDGGSRSDLPEEEQLPCHRRTKGFYDVYGRMAWDAPAPTITGGCINPSKGRFLHPEQDRAITLREALLLQGFPSGFRISLREGRYRAAELIGNAFPPPFAAAQAHELGRSLDRVSERDARVRFGS